MNTIILALSLSAILTGAALFAERLIGFVVVAYDPVGIGDEVIDLYEAIWGHK